jgi:hypothetical protein
MEKRLNRVEDQVARGFSNMNSIDKRLTKIELQAVQIKYTIFGAVGVFLLSQLGIVDLMKVII